MRCRDKSGWYQWSVDVDNLRWDFFHLHIETALLGPGEVKCSAVQGYSSIPMSTVQFIDISPPLLS